MKIREIIPQAATVTLPAADYYELISLVNSVQTERSIQLDALEIQAVKAEDGSILDLNVNYADVPAFAKEMHIKLAKLCAKDPKLMDTMVQKNYVAIGPWSHYFSTYGYTGYFILNSVPEFKKAWAEAVERLGVENDEE